MNYYVYIYYDPRKIPYIPIYVGKGKGKRINSHKSKAKNPILKRKLDKIKEANLEPIIEKFKDEISNEEALNLEIELIAKYGRIDLGTGTLCNLTNGGETTTGWIPSEETRKKWSEQRKGKKQTEAQYKANCSRIVTEKTRIKQSIANKGHKRHTPEQLKILKIKGRKHSQKTKILFSEQRKGKKQTEAQYKANCNRDNSRSWKKVKCINNGIIYKSVKEAARLLNMSQSGIAAVARGERNHYKNHIFEYIKEPLELLVK